MQHRSNRTTRILATIFATTLISAMMIMLSPSVIAQTSLSQCNGTDNVGGQAVECHYTVTNNLDGSTTSSTVTLNECHGAANDPATLVCSSSTVTSTDLITIVDQCNGSGNGGGGTVVCTVDVVNNITGAVAATATSVNQCNASGTGGGTEPTVLCDPFPASTTSADVTQCNESGNGGGGTQRVQCSVDSDSTSSTVLAVTINQCNGSGNGGGATVTCRAGMTTNITQPSPSPTPSDTPAPSETPAPSGTPAPSETPGLPGPSPSPTDGPAGGAGGPDDDGPGDSDSPNESGGGPGDGTTNQITRVPTGGAGAGGGSTSGVENLTLLLLGLGFMVLGSAVLIGRRTPRRIEA